MRKILTAVAAFILMSPAGYAQGVFKHWAIGAEVSTSGIGLDIATSVTSLIQLRAGFDVMPGLKYSNAVNLETIEGYNIDMVEQYLPLYNTLMNRNLTVDDVKKVDIEGKLTMSDVKFLVDVYPFVLSNFHITAGVFIGPEKVVEAYNTGASKEVMQDVYLWNTYCERLGYESYQIGVPIGNRFIKPDANGQASAELRVNGVKPYLGIGFGRAVPRHKRFGLMLEAGCKFWGKPKIYEHDTEVTTEELQGKDNGWMERFHKWKVYPHVSIRLCGKIL